MFILFPSFQVLILFLLYFMSFYITFYFLFNNRCYCCLLLVLNGNQLLFISFCLILWCFIAKLIERQMLLSLYYHIY